MVTLPSLSPSLSMNGHFLFRLSWRKWDPAILRTSPISRPLKPFISPTFWNKSPGITWLEGIAIDGEQMSSPTFATQLPRTWRPFLPFWVPETRHSPSSHAGLGQGHLSNQGRSSSCFTALVQCWRRLYRSINPEIGQVVPTRTWLSRLFHHWA